MEQRRLPPEPAEERCLPARRRLLTAGCRAGSGRRPGLLALIIAGLVVAYFLTRDDDDDSNSVAVPAVVGFSQAEAERQTRVRRAHARDSQRALEQRRAGHRRRAEPGCRRGGRAGIDLDAQRLRRLAAGQVPDPIGLN